MMIILISMTLMILIKSKASYLWPRGRQSPSPHVNSSMSQLKNVLPTFTLQTLVSVWISAVIQVFRNNYLVNVSVVLRGSLEQPVSLKIVQEKLPKERDLKEASEKPGELGSVLKFTLRSQCSCCIVNLTQRGP